MPKCQICGTSIGEDHEEVRLCLPCTERVADYEFEFEEKLDGWQAAVAAVKKLPLPKPEDDRYRWITGSGHREPRAKTAIEAVRRSLARMSADNEGSGRQRGRLVTKTPFGMEKLQPDEKVMTEQQIAERVDKVGWCQFGAEGWDSFACVETIKYRNARVEREKKDLQADVNSMATQDMTTVIGHNDYLFVVGFPKAKYMHDRQTSHLVKETIVDEAKRDLFVVTACGKKIDAYMKKFGNKPKRACVACQKARTSK